MSLTKIANLFVPAVWIPAALEISKKLPSFMNSGAVYSAPGMDDLASGAGQTVNMPFLIEPTTADEVQIEDAGPSIGGLASGQQVAAINNRVSTLGTTALAKAASGTDPVGTALESLARQRLLQREAMVVAMVNALFDGPLAAHLSDIATEDGDNAMSANLLSPSAFTTALNLLGTAKRDLAEAGALIMHPDVETALSAADFIETIRDSEGRFVLRTFAGLPVFLSDDLVRDGTTSGKVYRTVIAGRNTFGMGVKPQTSETGDAASLVIDGDAFKNNVTLYDRNRLVLHPDGLSWTPQVGVPAAPGGPTNVELRDADNWTLVYNDHRNVRLIAIDSNG